MPYFSDPLDAAQYLLLRGDGADPSYAADQLVFLCPNADVFKARVNGAISGGPFAEVAYDGVTFGAYTDIRIGQRIIISPTNDKRDPDALTGRIRATPTNLLLYINETSQDIADDSYIFVVNDYPLMDRLARPDPASPTTQQLKDYDLTYEPLPPLVAGWDGTAGLQPSYVQRVSGGVATFLLDASNAYATDLDSYLNPIAAWTWDFDDTGAITVLSGGYNQEFIEFEIDEGFQWGHLTIEDSEGTETLFHFQIHPWGTVYTPVLGFTGASIQADLDNYASCTLTGYTDVDTVLDNTWITVVRSPEFYCDTEGQLIEGDPYYVEFVGFLSAESDPGAGDDEFSFLASVDFEVVSVAQRLAQIEMQAIMMRMAGTPDEWDEIAQLVPYRALAHLFSRQSTASSLIPLSFTEDVLNDVFVYPYFTTVGAQNFLSACNDILQGANAQLEFWPNGVVEGVRDIRYIADKSAYLVMGAFDNRDLSEIGIAHRHLAPVGKIYASGETFNPTNSQVTAYKAIAPGTAQYIGADSNTLGGQIGEATTSQATGQAELNQRAGNFLAILNDEGNELRIKFPTGGYLATVYPSRNVQYTWALDGSENVRGIVYTTSTKWLCVSTSNEHDNDGGSKSGEAVFIRVLPTAAPGDAIPQIVPSEQTDSIPDLAPFPAFEGLELPEFTFPLDGLGVEAFNPLAYPPPTGQVAKKDGSTVIIKSDGQSYLLQNVIAMTTPQSNEVTPLDLGDFEIQQALFDPLNLGKTGGNNYGYLLSSDSDNSHVHRAANIFAHLPSWLTGDDIAGLYNVLRGTNVDGGLMVYSPTAGSSVFSVHAITDVPGNSTGISVTSGDSIDIATTGTWSNDGITTWDADGEAVAADGTFVLPGANRYCLIGRIGTSGSWFSVGASYSNTASASGILYLMMNDNLFGDNTGTLSSTIEIDGVGAGGAAVRFTSDRGETFAAALQVGSSFGAVGGFDVQRSGTNSYAASDGKVRRATTLGGAYSDYYAITGGAQAVCIIVPYFNYAGVKQTSATHPDIIVALNQLDGSSRSLLWIEGGATPGTVHDITPVAGIVFDSPNAVTVSYNTNIAVIGTVSGNRRCYTSTNIGAAWTLRLSSLSSSAQFVRTRRGDTRAKNGGNHGQIFVINGAQLKYSATWGLSFGNRTLPITAQGLDILG